MHSTRLIHLMMAALSVTAVTGVAWLDNQHAGAGQLAVRADIISIGPDLTADSTTDASAADPTTSSDDATDDSTTSTPAATTSNTPTPTTSDESTPTPTTSDASTPTPTTADNTTPTTGGTTATTPPPTTARTTPTTAAPTPSETSSDGNGGSGDNSSDDTTEVPRTTPPPVTSTFITVITSTDAAGQTHVSSSSSIIVSTPSPVADTSGDDRESGMSPQVRNTIIGVCVGVGGAIVLAAAGVLFWRLRNNRRSQEENEELVSYGDGFGGPGTAEKSEPSGSTAGRSPFQSTLESYHAPTQTNAASNF
ncbi:hypothetical protein F5Y00DRAFT_231904 [Daldinia vernicosa]|uniref:uncharacterized protein n=1 Tax=Daldinia vernicosa TaxID=114800 RepID=UPI002007234B|nr:uncharacterized protein F5Y00DRAFT_231904 [Daldinia vernicosa]KAI0850729.1 hypothetical protein F5Y00DRAFT_231904 [Daldinia vernicosa]